MVSVYLLSVCNHLPYSFVPECQDAKSRMLLKILLVGICMIEKWWLTIIYASYSLQRVCIWRISDYPRSPTIKYPQWTSHHSECDWVSQIGCVPLPGDIKVLSSTPICFQTYHKHSYIAPVPGIRDSSNNDGHSECPPSVKFSPAIDPLQFTLGLLSHTPGGLV